MSRTRSLLWRARAWRSVRGIRAAMPAAGGVRAFIACAAMTCGVIGGAAIAAAQPYTVDIGHTRVLFTVSHLGFSIQPGVFRDIDVRFAFDRAHPENSTLEVAIKANSNEPLDVRGLMVAEGINFPPGAEAFFNPATGQVWMRNTRENRRLAEWFLEVVMKEVRVDVRAIEIEQNRAAIYSAALSFAELEKRLGHAPVVFAGATVVTKSQQRVVGNHREGDEATASKPKTATEDKTKIEDSDWPPPRDVRRTFLEAEPTIGPDGVTVDCQFKGTSRNLTYWKLITRLSPRTVSYSASP